MNFLCTYFLLYVINVHGYDVQLEGNLRISDDFTNTLLKSIKPVPDAVFRVSDTNETHIKDERNNLKTNDKEKENNLISTDKDKDDKLPKETDMKALVKKYKDHVKEKGVNNLHSLNRQIVNQLKIENSNETSKILYKIIHNFKKELKMYAESASEKDPVFDIDKEFFMLDMVETINKIFHSEARKLLNEIIEKHNISFKNVDVQIATEIVYEKSVDDKKEEMKYICTKMKICRPFPGFTDYLADLVSDILKLSQYKFRTFLALLENLLWDRKQFFHSIISFEDFQKIRRNLKILVQGDMSDMREFFSVLRSIITRRYKSIDYKNQNVLTIKTKAIRILLDIIDKAFWDDDEELIALNFENVVRALREWSLDNKLDISRAMDDFTKHTTKVLRYSWSPDTKEEVKTLIEIIINGKSENDIIYTSLLRKGSKYVSRV